MKVIEKIFGIFFKLLGLIFCGIGLCLVISQIIENPTYVPCYVGAVFLTTVTVLVLFFLYCSFNLPIPSCKPKPKTFSIYLTIWFIVVIYVCALGAALLWWGFTVAEHLRGLLLAFAIVLTTFGGVAVGGLFWQLIIRQKNKIVLKHGIETEATFIDSDTNISVHSGKDIGGTRIFLYYVKFRYFNGEKEIIVKSQSMYSQTEARYFELMDKFLVKYKGKRAVISQLPEDINENI
ncbi:MAG: hypothetical protein J1F68_03035 [Clostridiales bacterium]|nr:hypothetical protein [Clostridiales bacterium]